MAESSTASISIRGCAREFYVDNPRNHDYSIGADKIENDQITASLDALADHVASSGVLHPEDLGLSIWLDRADLFPWEKSHSVIVIYLNNGRHCAEFALNTAIEVEPDLLRDAVSLILAKRGFTLRRLQPTDSMGTILEEPPKRSLADEDGYTHWICDLFVSPSGTFAELFILRREISQAVFLSWGCIETPSTALRLLQLGQPQALIGLEESEWLECKSSPYELKDVHGDIWKHELAEDVAQFANTVNGGLLVIGLRTKRLFGIDVIERITAAPVSETRLQSYRDVLRRRIHPPISGLRVESVAWQSGQLISIFVPPQDDVNQPYLVSGVIARGQGRPGVTIVRRQGDAAISMTAAEVHALLVAGRAFLRQKPSA